MMRVGAAKRVLLATLCAVALGLGAGAGPSNGVAAEPIACEGDACQPLPSPPIDPVVTTGLEGPGNPPVRYEKICRKGYAKRQGECVKRGKKKRQHARGRSTR